jgi:hypothetical protein
MNKFKLLKTLLVLSIVSLMACGVLTIGLGLLAAAFGQ